MSDPPAPSNPTDPPTEPRAARLVGPLFRLDPGWLFLVAGLVLVSATVLIPALDDLRQAEWNRDRARAAEAFRKERLANYSEYLDAVRAGDRTLTVSLAATQLNLAPADKRAMLDASQVGLPDLDVFASLEPNLVHPPQPRAPDSILQKWTTSASARPWLLAAGGLFMLIGLLPPAGTHPPTRRTT